jgi:uncharacterized protein DUF6166
MNTEQTTRSLRYVGKRSENGPTVTRERDNGRKSLLPLRLDLWNHSPSGFEWGYGGSGPAQLALAILADAIGDEEAVQHHQRYKFAVIGNLPHDEWTIGREEVLAWYDSEKKQ